MFSGKKQSRIWLVSVIYKSILKKHPLVPLTNVSSVRDLEEFFQDEVIFSYEKGDFDYFFQIYSSLVSNILKIKQKLANLLKVETNFIESNTNINPFICSCLMLAITEIDHIGIESWIVIAAYKELIRNYAVDGSEKMMNLLADNP